jgi:hypothetical protein
VAAQEFAGEEFGITDTSYHYISAEEFQETSRPFPGSYIVRSDGFWSRGNSWAYYFVAPLRLPAGALVDGYVIIYDDSDASRELSLELYRYWVGGFGATGSSQIGSTFTSSGTPGVRSTWIDLDPDITIRYQISASNTTQSYRFNLTLDLTPDLRFRGIIVHWKRQVSAAPATATFGDVPTGHPFFPFVEALVASGITAGCGGGNFCPDDPLTRGQMAVFLSAALGLHWAP